ncbi:MAG: HD domain-containing protein [Pseudomonadota bacterium]
MSIAAKFAPYEKLASQLLPHAIGEPGDAAHDETHLLRVWKNVQTISEAEGGDLKVLAAATLLHDCSNVPKDSPNRSRASQVAAQKATRLLSDLGWSKTKISEVGHAIEAHSFSAHIEPVSIEAKILQDADRLDAIGYTGVARCFYVSGRLGRALYDPIDPDGSNRELNDLDFAIDHFKTLLRLYGSFQTETGNAQAYARHSVVLEFLKGFLAEVALER